MSPIVSPDTDGLSTHGNDLAAKIGSTSVADNVSFSREGRPERRRGFKDYSTNLPDYAPAQLIASAAGDQAYLHLDNGIWYHDGTNWLRKRGSAHWITDQPNGVAYLGGHLYVTSSTHTIYDYNLATGRRSILAGRTNVSGHTNGTGDSARFFSPAKICTDGTDLYVADKENHCVRKVTTAGVVTDLAGTTGTTSGHTNGTGSAALFNNPYGICWDGADLYLTETSNHCIRKVTLAGVVTDFAGTTGTTSGHTNATGTAARFNGPNGICWDGSNFYIADTGNHCVRKVTTGAVVTDLAGTTGTTSGHVDDTGTAARFNAPTDIYSDGTDLYVPESGNDCVRKVTTAGVVTTAYGTTGTTSGYTDGISTDARFSNPNSIVYVSGIFYVADLGNLAVRKIYKSTGYVSTIVNGMPSVIGIVVGPD